MGKTFYVYILAGNSRRLYIGFTNNRTRRIGEHKSKLVPGFTARYNIDRLVHYEEFSNPRDGIAREKELKRWRRSKKVALIESANPGWVDLYIQRGHSICCKRAFS